ncbi:uncharacterized protein N7459_007550 [Penicillium hispanicum]|uniref:uncharacterized protein n=1 Tax=Penicillium hispanicum TaxID=1080232 RepID=UPI0025404757|nr:uncharacterized protein N7459_007550 [Penicillium hispanicum]KAJ5578586.1 hypothetical protein N7459_007550 [Penicillium hispanicum]
MTITYRHGLSIFELIVYFPSLFLASFLVFRHGLLTNAGFLFVVLFALCRIVGACCDLATISNYSTSLFIAAAICSSIGLSPLMLVCSGLLSRANKSIKRVRGHGVLPWYASHAFRFLTIIAMVLTIVGITNNMSEEALLHPDSLVKVGIILYLAAFVVLEIFLVVIALRRNSLEPGEHRILLAVAISSPFILVRVLYVLFVWFLHNSTFGLMNGNVTVQLVMSVLEEMAVIVICLGVGLTLPVRKEGSGGGEELTRYGKP